MKRFYRIILGFLGALCYVIIYDTITFLFSFDITDGVIFMKGWTSCIVYFVITKNCGSWLFDKK
jgi:hypothetical protein